MWPVVPPRRLHAGLYDGAPVGAEEMIPRWYLRFEAGKLFPACSLAPCVTRSVIGDGATEALGIHPRPIEAAGASLPFGEHIAGTLDPLQARLFLLGGLDPLDPIPARDGRDVRPYRPRLRVGGRESLPQICRHPGFRPLCHRRDFQRADVARL